MVCFQNSRNRSSTAREEPAVRRINDVNPRNGSATSLANSQSSPSPPVPPPSYPAPREPPFPLSVSPFPRLPPPVTPGTLLLRFGSDLDTTRRTSGATRPPDLCPLLSPVRPLCRSPFSRAYNTIPLPPLLVGSVTILHARFFFGVHRRRLLPRHPAHGISK